MTDTQDQIDLREAVAAAIDAAEEVEELRGTYDL